MQLLVWNIQSGGGARLERIVEEVSAHDPDVFVATAYREIPGDALCAAMRERGWPHVQTSTPAAKQNGIAVFSRTPMARLRQWPVACEERHRWLDVDLPAHGFGLSVLHIMAAVSAPTREAKIQFWDAVLRAAAARADQPFLFAGDWNTGQHKLDEPAKTFVCAEHFAKLSALGWTDLWRHHNPGPTEFTWYSARRGGVRGNGFRVDHCFASAPLLPRVRFCRYSHVEREARLSDHSAMLVDVD
jgi:exonuclease III